MKMLLATTLVGLSLGIGGAAEVVEAGGRCNHWRYPDTPGFYPQRTTFGFGRNSYGYGGNRNWNRGGYPTYGFDRGYYAAPRRGTSIYLNFGRTGRGRYRGW